MLKKNSKLKANGGILTENFQNILKWYIFLEIVTSEEKNYQYLCSYII